MTDSAKQGLFELRVIDAGAYFQSLTVHSIPPHCVPDRQDILNRDILIQRVVRGDDVAAILTNFFDQISDVGHHLFAAPVRQHPDQVQVANQ